MKPLSEFSCINPVCLSYGKKGLSNLKVQQTYGKHEPIRLLECKVCGLRFSERAGTALSGSRLPREKVLSVLHHLAEGCGHRRICRLVGVSRGTVSRLARIAGEHAQSLHDQLVRGLEVSEAQTDEKWGFVVKKREPL